MALNIVFMGSPEFAVPSLEYLAKSIHTIKAVVTGEDKHRGRRSSLSPTPIKAKALELGLPIITIDSLKTDEIYQVLKSLEADLFVIVAYKILPNQLLSIPKLGSINLHASLLPKYRGAAPIHWAVINGEIETGVTTFFLNEGIDTGKIILQKSWPILNSDTTGSIYSVLKELGAELIVESVNRIAEGNYELYLQDDSKSCPAPKISKEDARIDFTKPAKNLHNFIRGMNPFPGAWTTLDGQQINIHQTELTPENLSINLEPGLFELNEEHLIVGTGAGLIEIQELQVQGKIKVSGFDFINGWRGNTTFE